MKYDVLIQQVMYFYFLVKPFIFWLEKLRIEFSNSASNIPSQLTPTSKHMLSFIIMHSLLYTSIVYKMIIYILTTMLLCA